MTITPQNLHDKLKFYFGFNTFRGMQEEIILHLINGNNAFVLMPTGGGKSLCYQLPALLMDGTAIIISPLIALMKNQVDAIRGFVEEQDGLAHFLNSSLTKSQNQEVKDHLLSGKTKLLYVAPESLTKEENIQLLKKIKISFFAVDEAHCISEWGHDFRPEYRKIQPIVSEIGRAPIIALTATATPKVQQDIQRNLGMLKAKVFKTSFNRENLYYEIRNKVNVEKEILKFINLNKGKSGIVYCLSRKKVEDIATFLNINGIRALPYHAGLDANTRAANQDKFLMEEVDVIVATIAFGMGIDKPDVRFVIHHDIPKSLEGYYQETGRSGRDGGEGQCITFYSHKDLDKLEKFMQNKHISEQEIGRQLLNETMAFAESNICRRKILMNYFGEEYTQPNCGSCDNCLNPKKTFDGQEDLSLVLELIASMKEQFKPDYHANLLVGNINSIIKSYNHDTHPMFGIGKDQGVKYWTAILRQAIIQHYLEKDVERYGVLECTTKGLEFLKNPHEVLFVEDREFIESEDDDDISMMAGSKSGGGGGDETLLAMLKDLRSSLAKRLKLPSYVIFQDTSLEDMTIQYPIALEDLKMCQGVGEGKAKKFGKEFVELIAKYVEENDIDRPDDFVVKSIINKSSDKIYIIDKIDKRVPLDEIADSKGLEMDEILLKIESIVNSGTRINIDYYIQLVVDDDKVNDIYEYFKVEALTDSIQDAVKELGKAYTEEEIRLVRIKFLSEMGN